MKLHCCDTTEVNEEVCSNYRGARNWRLETELSEALQLNCCKADFSETRVLFTLVLITRAPPPHTGLQDHSQVTLNSFLFKSEQFAPSSVLAQYVA